MAHTLLAIAIHSLLATLGFAVATYSTANDFFDRLVLRYPELAQAFPKPSPVTRYGPIRPSYMAYLKARKHFDLPDPDLREQGARILLLLNLHAISFLVLVLSGLSWGLMRGA